MDKKQIQRKRIMSYFIDSAAKIIDEEGIENITIRKVSDLAGYNSATLYNYFENLDHLVFLASMRFVKEYAFNLSSYVAGVENDIEKHIKIWKCFCDYSFRKPKIYHAIFFAKLDKHFDDYIHEYYSLYPEDIANHLNGLSTMLLKHDIYERGKTTLRRCVDKGIMSEEDMIEINEMTILVYEGILNRLINNKINYNQAVDKVMKYIYKILKAYNIQM